MNKNKRTPVLLIIILLISLVAVIILFATLIFCTTCFASAPPGEQPASPGSTGADLGPVILTDESPVYTSFEKAASGLGDIPGLSRDHESRLQISYIKGENVDENGWAARWLFEARSDSGSELRVFDRRGWTVIPWNVTHVTESISLDGIVSPTVLFNQSRSLIAENNPSPSGREIELQGNVYTLTINSVNASRVMRFDATTGALIA